MHTCHPKFVFMRSMFDLSTTRMDNFVTAAGTNIDGIISVTTD